MKMGQKPSRVVMHFQALTFWLAFLVAGELLLLCGNHFARVANLHLLRDTLLSCVVTTLHLWPVKTYCVICQ